MRRRKGSVVLWERGQKAVEDLRRWSDEMEVRGQGKEAACGRRASREG